MSHQRRPDIAVADLGGVLSPTGEVFDPIESRFFRGPREWASSLKCAGVPTIGVAISSQDILMSQNLDRGNLTSSVRERS